MTTKAVDKDLKERFTVLYEGLDRAYGTWHVKHKARTIKRKAGSVQWAAHLEGKLGIGIIPITKANKCSWGAIDIDVDDIDHEELAQQVARMKLPLIVCRSKSGGAHCYIFTKKPVSPKIIRKHLSHCAYQLGYGDSEIFPKQDKLKEGEVGNWINLPYFEGVDTKRYAVNEHGDILSLKQFIEAAEKLKSHTVIVNKKTDKDKEGEPPPCLAYFLDKKVEKGSRCRNELLFNYAVFFRGRYSSSWEERVFEINYSNFEAPLSKKEVTSIVNSVDKKKYSYRCDGPIGSYCDRIHCQTLQFGVKAINQNYGELMLGSLSKIMTDPPRWELEINGEIITLTTEEIMNFKAVRVACMERIDLIAPPMKAEDWLQLLRERMENKRVVEAPEDASQDGQVTSTFHEFLAMADRTTERSDILRGLPVRDNIKDKDVIIFRGTDFANFLRRKRVAFTSNNTQLWMILRKVGCDHGKVRIEGVITRIWYIHSEAMEEMPEIPTHEENVEV